MTPLRQKMIRAMELRNLAKNTQRGYLTAVTGITRHYRQSPLQLTQEMIEDYLLHLKNNKGNTPGSCASVVTGLRFFYHHVADKPFPINYSFTKKRSHLLEAGHDLRRIQVLMGHTILSTTMIYLHVSRKTLSKIPSPLDLIDTKHAKKEDRTDGPNH
jgi:site-specific recombinase XerD